MIPWSFKKSWLRAFLLVPGICVLSFQAVLVAQTKPPAQIKELPLPGEAFSLADRPAFVLPAYTNLSVRLKPWVWYAPTLPGLPGREERWMFERLLAAGVSIAGIDVGESYGSPAGRRLFTAFYEEMTQKRGFSAKPVLLGRSRGGLMTLAWAAENPEKVGAFAGIYPVCNIASYPGLAKAAPAYALPPETLEAHLTEHNPIDRLAGLARAHVPFFAIHGDVDTVVPLSANSGLLKDRYERLGGVMQLIVPKGQGHNMWEGFFHCTELIDFVEAHAGVHLSLSAPLDYQVLQRTAKPTTPLHIRGSVERTDARPTHLEARLTVGGKPGQWQPFALQEGEARFDVTLDTPEGGWHGLEVRAFAQDELLGQVTVSHVGVGEVFVMAGQSNSANHGEEKQTTRTGMVSHFNGQRWGLANDPQPGASGNGGSFIPPFGDAMAERFHVPVGIVACGVGATSVREWQPKGTRFPNPPTLLGQVQQTVDGAWECKGTIYDNFIARMKQMGRNGFRAVLWHQGESDANQADPSRTLPGDLYTGLLRNLITRSRRDIGWDAPWFVAQASYHTPQDTGSAEIRAAQAALWKDGLTLPGPDTDSLQGDMRDSHGQGVHFSGAGLRQHAALWFAQVAPWLEKQ